jgi:hypothetical protein
LISFIFSLPPLITVYSIVRTWQQLSSSVPAEHRFEACRRVTAIQLPAEFRARIVVTMTGLTVLHASHVSAVTSRTISGQVQLAMGFPQSPQEAGTPLHLQLFTWRLHT